jgi:fermentation-respiration switch protein FrsA (DUF1100 family)
MGISIDGRQDARRWTAPAAGIDAVQLQRHYDDLAVQFHADGWIVGRVTMEEFAHAVPRPVAPVTLFPDLRSTRVGDRALDILGRDFGLGRKETEMRMHDTLRHTAEQESNFAFGRRDLLKLAAAGVAAIGAGSSFNISNAEAQNMSQQWDKVFPKSENVAHQKVTFRNRYGITLVGDLYLPKDRGGNRLAALAVGGPFGAVKEQSSGLYAQTMAERGFVTLAFDPSYTGESGGEPRNVASPDINTEDFSAAVDYLGLHSSVDRERIGIIGICGWGGMALNAVAVDKRIKAVATSTMYDMTRVMSRGYNDSVTLEQRTQTLEQLSRQRWQDAEKGNAAYGPVSNELKGGEPQFLVDYADYYKTPRGFHPRAINSNASWTVTTPLSFMNMPLLTYIKEISPRPILLIHGEKAHSRYFSETAYKAAAEPKELVIIPGANHVDLYDRVKLIPWDKLASFFGKHLNPGGNDFGSQR